MSDPSSLSSSARRARPRLTEQIQVIRELWLLREQARVQAAERCFLAELERLLSARLSSPADEPAPRPPAHAANRIPRTRSAPPPPPPPPAAPVPRAQTAEVLSDGHVFESFPPPRDHESAPARERRGLVHEEVADLRSRQRVTNLSPEFRALLEGNGPTPDYRTLGRSRSFGQLSHQRNVSNALESEFRHHLERIMVRRDLRATSPQMRHVYHTGDYSMDMEGSTGMTSEYPHHDGDDYEARGRASSAAMEAVVRALRDEVNVLKNVISASFDLQLDIQRSIRQEVSAAMNSPARLSWGPPRTCEDMSACTTETGGEAGPVAGATARKEVGAAAGMAKAAASGVCTICLEKKIDALLYACGHMCTCSMCGRQLIATGQACPICRAPVRDVVRAFVVTE